MERSAYLILVLMISAPSFGQIPPLIEWQKSYGGSQVESSRSMIRSADGGYMVASITYSTDGDLSQNTDGREIWLMKLDAQGGLQWQNWYGSIYTTSAKLKVRQTPDGGFIVVTTIGINAAGVGCEVNDTHGWVFKVDEVGEMQWEQCLGGSDSDGLRSIEPTSDGGYILSGGSSSIDGDLPGNNGSGDIWVLKMDAEGDVLWSKNYGGTDGEGALDAIETSDGGFLVGGAGRSNDLLFQECNPYSPLNNTAFILKLDEDGNVVWRRCYGGNNEDIVNKVLESEDGNYWIVGTTTSTDGIIDGHHGGVDGWVIKLAPDGELLLNEVFGGSASDYFQDARCLANGNIRLLGYTHSTDGDVVASHGLSDVWLVESDAGLNLVWQETYGGANHELGHSIALNSDGSAIFCGSGYSSDGDLTENNGSADAWIVKLKPWDDTSVEETGSMNGLALYPNPANELLQVELTDMQSPAAIEICDALGRIVLSEGSTSMKSSIAIDHLNAGTYHVIVTSNGNVRLYGRFIKL